MQRIGHYGKRTFASIYNYTSTTNPRVWFAISQGEKDLGKIEFEVFENHVPNTANRFIERCDPEAELSYKDTEFTKVIDGFMAQGGDISGDSERHLDENLELRHETRGTLTTQNTGPHSVSSEFMLTFGKTPWLDGYHTPFAQMTNGEDILASIEAAGSRDGTPAEQFVISDCGRV